MPKPWTAWAGAKAKQGQRSAGIIPLNGLATGEPDKGEGPVDARLGERADQGWSALDFRVKQDRETKEGKPRALMHAIPDVHPAGRSGAVQFRSRRNCLANREWGAQKVPPAEPRMQRR